MTSLTWDWLDGFPALDLVNTVKRVGWRERELLRTPADLDSWLDAATLPAPRPASVDEADLRAVLAPRDPPLRPPRAAAPPRPPGRGGLAGGGGGGGHPPPAGRPRPRPAGRAPRGARPTPPGPPPRHDPPARRPRRRRPRRHPTPGPRLL